MPVMRTDASKTRKREHDSEYGARLRARSQHAYRTAPACAIEPQCCALPDDMRISHRGQELDTFCGPRTAMLRRHGHPHMQSHGQDSRGHISQWHSKVHGMLAHPLPDAHDCNRVPSRDLCILLRCIGLHSAATASWSCRSKGAGGCTLDEHDHHDRRRAHAASEHPRASSGVNTARNARMEASTQ